MFRRPVDLGAEGTAMMEIVHDLAPGAELRFCAPATSLDMERCIDAAARASGGVLPIMPHLLADDPSHLW